MGGGRDANGREIEGFGALAQRQGAKAVLATLWPVVDRSTGEFMQTFYRIRQTEAGITKAEALRRAQVQFIRSNATANGTSSRGVDAPENGSTKAGGALQHQFYWAPFILMGNWL